MASSGSAASPAPTPSKTSSTQGLSLAQELDLSDVIDAGGVFPDDLAGDLRYGNNSRIRLDIESGTRALEKGGNPLAAIEIDTPSTSPAPPTDGRIINAFELGPSGAIFTRPIRISYQYDPVQLTQGENARNLYFAYFNPRDNKWVNCDYMVDTQNRRISANISHLSLYAVIIKNGAGLMSSVSGIGVSWSLIGTIVSVTLLRGVLAIYLYLRWRRPLVPATEAAAANYDRATISEPPVQTVHQSLRTDMPKNKEYERIIQDDVLQKGMKAPEVFQTHLIVVGGKVIIPRDGKSTDIELINMPDSRILITVKYDSELYPKGSFKIALLGSSSEYQELMEVRK
jgi:hypothetical protein